MSNRYTKSWIVALAWASAGAFCAIPAPAFAQNGASEGDLNPLRIVLGREHTGSYTGGKTVDVNVRISASTWDGITAMGLYEKIPEGWTLEDVRLISGVPPSVSPDSGAGGVLQFIWILPPRAPVLMRYSLRVPPRDSGVRTLTGQIEYRRGGGKLASGVALTQIDGVADELPVVELIGDAEMSVDQFSDFEDPGATATDKEDGTLTERIQVAGRVDTAKLGSYTLTYGVMDRTGNRAEPVSRTVTVEPATANPGTNTDSGSPSPRPSLETPRGTSGRAQRQLKPAKPREAPKTGVVLPVVEIPELEGGGPTFSLSRKESDGRTAESLQDPVAGGRNAETFIDPDAQPNAVLAMPKGNGDRYGFPADSTGQFDVTPPDRRPAIAFALAVISLIALGCWTAARTGHRRGH